MRELTDWCSWAVWEPIPNTPHGPSMEQVPHGLSLLNHRMGLCTAWCSSSPHPGLSSTTRATGNNHFIFYRFTARVIYMRINTKISSKVRRKVLFNYRISTSLQQYGSKALARKWRNMEAQGEALASKWVPVHFVSSAFPCSAKVLIEELSMLPLHFCNCVMMWQRCAKPHCGLSGGSFPKHSHLSSSLPGWADPQESGRSPDDFVVPGPAILVGQHNITDVHFWGDNSLAAAELILIRRRLWCCGAQSLLWDFNTIEPYLMLFSRHICPE